MNARAKKILLIILFILSIFVIGFALYFMFFRITPGTFGPGEQQPGVKTQGKLPTTKEGSPIAQEQPEIAPETGLPPAEQVANGGVTQTTTLTTGPVANIALSSDGKSVNFYNKEDGFFYTIDKDGNVVRLSNQTFPDVKNVEWNRDAKKAVLEFPDGSNIVYNFQMNQQVTLPKQWEDFSFSPKSDQLEAKNIALDPDNNWLVYASDAGTNIVPFQALGENASKVQVSWSPNDQVLAFSDTAAQVSGDTQSNFDTHVIYPIGKNKENFRGLKVEGFGFSPSWSPNGKQLLYSVYGDYSNGKPLLWTVNATASSMGENRHSLGLNTWIDKCVWNSDTVIYCAVPQNLPENAGLQPSLYADLPDSLYKVNLANGQNSLIAIPDQSQTMKNLSVSKDGALLYYTDAATGQLKLIKLK